MQLSYRLLREYLPLTASPETLSEWLTSIGLEVDALEEVEAVRGGLAGLVVGEVMTKEKHPDADRLSVTTVNTGAEELLQIVCGAANVAVGQKVVVASVGTTIYPTTGDAVTMKRSKIRGVESQGMICAEDEIGLGASHEGILVLPATAAVGQPLAELFGLTSDHVFEIGLTPNRADAQSHVGVARDLAAFLAVQGTPVALTLPNVSAFATPTAPTAHPRVTISPDAAAAAPRYAGVVIDGVTVGSSPAWLSQHLQSLGIRSVNVVVDVTNFVLHELGQPLHAFDYHTLRGGALHIGYAPADTTLTTLDGIERKLAPDDLTIQAVISQQGVNDVSGSAAAKAATGANDILRAEPVCLAGVFGGITSGVTAATTSVFLESAFFAPAGVRRTAVRHGLRTEAARTFEKGVDPNGVVYALERAALLLCELAGGHIASPLIDIYPAPIAPARVVVRYARVNGLLGTTLDAATIDHIVEAMGMRIVERAADTEITLEVPTDKPDVTREADVTEEILRMYGINRIPAGTSVKNVLQTAPRPDAMQLRGIISNTLAAGGFFEMMALSLTQSRYCAEVLPVPTEELVFIHNTANKGLDVMRPTLVFGGLEAIAHNQNRQNPDVRLFEFGRVYRTVVGDTSPEFRERQLFGLFAAGRHAPESWHAGAKAEADFYTLKATLEQVLRRVGLFNSATATAAVADDTFAYSLHYAKGNNAIAKVGQLHPRIVKAFDVRGAVYYAEIDFDVVMKLLRKPATTFTELPKFPTVRRDLALVVAENVTFAAIESIVKKEAKKLLASISLFDVYRQAEHVGEGKKSYSISLVFLDPTRTLTDKDTAATMERVTAALEKGVGAELRK